MKMHSHTRLFGGRIGFAFLGKSKAVPLVELPLCHPNWMRYSVLRCLSASLASNSKLSCGIVSFVESPFTYSLGGRCSKHRIAAHKPRPYNFMPIVLDQVLGNGVCS